jgi:hypothetical protein
VALPAVMITRRYSDETVNPGPAHYEISPSPVTALPHLRTSVAQQRPTPARLCPPVTTPRATTDGDGRALHAAPDDSRRRHRQHRLSPLGCLDSSGATGGTRPGEGADGMTETPLPPCKPPG